MDSYRPVRQSADSALDAEWAATLAALDRVEVPWAMETVHAEVQWPVATQPAAVEAGREERMVHLAALLAMLERYEVMSPEPAGVWYGPH
ncbi:hypothetical protein [Chitinimonas koreensis]|nr:hypothetical protein [Chitinimonas koreensis]QNM98716.1 hypothetical protein H9L41_11135 [Chitinimonas koreensis]